MPQTLVQALAQAASTLRLPTTHTAAMIDVDAM